MSFGFAIGDVVAVLNLAERIATEIKNYRDAPARFHSLSAQLHLMDRTLRHVLSLEPSNTLQFEQIQNMRAIVMHCQQPLQKFLDLMYSKEKVLGHMKYARGFSAVRTRLHWSLIASSDIQELKTTLLSELAAINILLGVYQVSALNSLTKECIPSIRKQLADLKGIAEEKANQDALIIDIVSITPRAISELSSFVQKTTEVQKYELRKMNDRVSGMDQNLLSNTQSNIELIKTVKTWDERLRSATAGLMLTGLAVKRLIQLLLTCSREVLEQIKHNARMLLDIHSMLKRLLQAVESIPLHLTLPIVRLDDALGESWALPFQACTTWQSFKDVLAAVVFPSSRPGASYIPLDRFALFIAKKKKPITPFEWEDFVKAGARIQQAMLIPPTDGTAGATSSKNCSSASCKGTINALDSTCSKCGKWVGSDHQRLDLIRHMKQYPSRVDSQETKTQQPIPTVPLPPISLSEAGDDDEIAKFRRVYTIYQEDPIASLEEAEDILALDPDDAAANQYKGWFLLTPPYDVPNQLAEENAIHYLIKSINQDSTQALTYHLLGEAYLRLNRTSRAHSCFRQAVTRDARAPLVWISSGTLFYMLDQYRDSLDCLARSIRLNPYIAESWYNLGILYDACHDQKHDAYDAWERCNSLEPGFSDVVERLEEIQELRRNSQRPLPARRSQMMLPRLQHARDSRTQYLKHGLKFNFASVSDRETAHLIPGEKSMES